MANLLIAMIGIGFAAVLAVAGISYLNPTAFVEHNQSISNATQIESLAADYSTLSRNLGHRPTVADFQAEFPAKSSNSSYTYSSAGTSTVLSTSAAMTNGAQWTYTPSCGTQQDCFCASVSDGSSVTYQAARVAAMEELNSTTSSRLELGSTCAGTSDISDPHQWPSTVPANGYVLTLRLNGGATNNATQGTSYTYSAVPVTLCPPGCGSSIPRQLVSWSCVRSDGTTVTPSLTYCPDGPPANLGTCQNDSLCTTQGQSITGAYGPCIGGYETMAWTCQTPGGTILPQSQCTPPANATIPCATNPVNQNYTYSASAPTYGTCSAGCGTSTAPLVGWSCIRSDGSSVDQSNCVAAGVTPAATQACTSYAACIGSNPVYGTCSNTCGTGTQSLVSYSCTDVLGNPVPSSHCIAPPATQACTSTASCGYTATSAAYAGCTPACGSSVAIATNWTCTQSDGETVSQSVCLAHGISPILQACNDYSLCTPENVTYSACSNQCGEGTQTLLPSWTCGFLAQTTAQSKCVQPAASQPCNSAAGCGYFTSAIAWNPCSTTCGTGTQTASVYSCTLSNGTVLPQSACALVPTQSCTDTSGCYVHAVYGSCSASCGTGTQTLTSWACVDANGNPATPASTYCPTPPANSEACTATWGCTYTASAPTAWGSCSTTCGQGTQTATSFTCTSSSGSQVSMADCTAPTQSCSSTSGCYVHAIYGGCSASCGTGTQTLTSWACVDANGNPATPASAYCPTPPANSASCTATWGCNYTASNPTAWSSCSTTCGQGTQTATSFTCKDSNGNQVPLADCTAPTQACTSTSSCVAVGNYGNCSASCGAGTQTLISWMCQDGNGNQVTPASTYCPNAPYYTTWCYSTSGCTATASNPTAWGACSNSCGQGTQTATSFTCTSADGSQVPQSSCTAPTQSCTGTSGCTYTYTASNPTAWGACSNSCGQGTQTATSYTCTRSDGSQVSQSQCTAPTQSCNGTSGCTYSYAPGNIVYGNTCAPANCGAPSYQELQSWQCIRYPDNAIVEDSYCANNQPASIGGNVCYNYATCFSYSASNPQYGPCVASCNGSTPIGTATLPTAVNPNSGGSYYGGFTCSRSDGNLVEPYESGCQALIGNSLPLSISCTPATPATCH